MKPITLLLAAAFVAAATLPAAAGPTLDAQAAQHFNRGVAAADRQSVPAAPIVTPSRAGGGSDALSIRAAERFNRGVALPDRQSVVPAAAPDPALDAYAAARFNRGVAPADRQSVPN
jgi:hypothetical protein